MKRHDLSRKQFLSLGVLGALGLLEACTLDDTASGSGGGSTTSTAATGGSGGSTSTTSSGSAGSGGSSTTGAAGSGGATGGAGAGGKGSGGAGGGGVDAGGGSGGTGGSGGSKDAAADAPKFDAGACTMVVIAAISMNHNAANNGPHYLRVPAADIVAGTDMVYETESTPNMTPQSHSHSIKLTAADLAALRAGMTVTKKSCDGHEHQFGLHCGTMAPVPAGTACMKTDFCGGVGNPC